MHTRCGTCGSVHASDDLSMHTSPGAQPQGPGSLVVPSLELDVSPSSLDSAVVVLLCDASVVVPVVFESVVGPDELVGGDVVSASVVASPATSSPHATANSNHPASLRMHRR